MHLSVPLNLITELRLRAMGWSYVILCNFITNIIIFVLFIQIAVQNCTKRTMSSDESRLSIIQKLCINTIKEGAITAFIDIFRLTHMEQPMGKNQPNNLNDLVSTSGPTVAEILHQFSFDNPLNFNQTKLLTIQSLLLAADTCQMNEDYFNRFDALSKLADIFFETQLARTQFRMMPLVTPHPTITSLTEENDTIGCADILIHITSPIFNRQAELKDPLMAAVAHIRSVEDTMQVYCPLDVYYAILARNTLYSMVKSIEDANSIAGLMNNILPPLKTTGDFTPSDPATIPKNLKTRMLLYTIVCYLRLGKSLHFFQLHRAAHGVLDVCLVAIAAIEQHLDIDFSAIFEPTTDNAYKVLIPDDLTREAQAEVASIDNQEKNPPKHTTFAGARLDVESVPYMPFTRLEEDALPTFFSDDPDENYASYIDTLAELAFVARMMMAHNLMFIACTAFSNAISENDLMFVRADVLALHAKISQLDNAFSAGDLDLNGSSTRPGDKQKGVDETLSVSSLTSPISLPNKILHNMPCSYVCALSGCVLLMNAADIAFEFNIYPLIMPICRRLFEITTRLNCTSIAIPYIDKLLAGDTEFAILGHSWAANWAAAKGDNDKLVQHLMARWKLANQELSNTAELLAEINQNSGTDLLAILNSVNYEERPPSEQVTLQPQKSRVRFDVASALSSMRSTSGSIDPVRMATNLDSIDDSGGPPGPSHLEAGFDMLDDLSASLLNPEEMLLTDNNLRNGLKEAVAVPIQIDDAPNTPDSQAIIQSDSELRAYKSAQKFLTDAGVPSVGRDMGSSGVLEITRTKPSIRVSDSEIIRRNIARARAMVGAREAVAAASALSCAGNTKKNSKTAPVDDLELMTGAWNTIAGIYASNDAHTGAYDQAVDPAAPSLLSTTVSMGGTLGASSAGGGSSTGLGKRSNAETMEKIIAEERRGVSTSVVEARVRLGAVKGQLLVQQVLGNVHRPTIEDANEGDLHDCLQEDNGKEE